MTLSEAIELLAPAAGEPSDVLARLRESLDPGARVIVIEYDRETANRWVPYPLPPERLLEVAERAGYGPPEIVARRSSAYHREMYCAYLAGTLTPARR